MHPDWLRQFWHQFLCTKQHGMGSYRQNSMVYTMSFLLAPIRTTRQGISATNVLEGILVVKKHPDAEWHHLSLRSVGTDTWFLCFAERQRKDKKVPGQVLRWAEFSLRMWGAHWASSFGLLVQVAFSTEFQNELQTTTVKKQCSWIKRKTKNPVISAAWIKFSLVVLWARPLTLFWDFLPSTTGPQCLNWFALLQKGPTLNA